MNVQDRSNTFDLNKYGVGQPVRRTEDPVLVQGQGRYTDDVDLPGRPMRCSCAAGMGTASSRASTPAPRRRCRACSPSIPARILSAYGTMKCAVPFKNRDGSEMKKPKRPSLMSDKVRFVGDPIAVVIAETLAQAKDAAEAVEVDIEPLTRRHQRERSRQARRAAAL